MGLAGRESRGVAVGLRVVGASLAPLIRGGVDSIFCAGWVAGCRRKAGGADSVGLVTKPDRFNANCEGDTSRNFAFPRKMGDGCLKCTSPANSGSKEPSDAPLKPFWAYQNAVSAFISIV